MSTDEEVIQRIDEEIKKLTDKLNKLPENDFTNRGIASKAIADQEILKGAKLSEMHTKEQEAINAARREARREAAVRRESARLEAVRVEAAAAREEKIARQPGEREATATRNLEENAAAVKKYANRENSAKIIQKRYRDNISKKNIEEAAQSAREDTAREIINNNCSNALSWPNNLQEALTILGLGTSETFFNLPNITKSLNDAYDKKNVQCVNHEVQGLDIQSYDEYKRNIAEAKAIIEQHIIRYNSKKCANANDQPKNVEQALFILGFGTIDELLSQQNANELLDNAYKNKTDACAKYVGFDKVSQKKYKYNIDQAKNIIQEQIALARRPETPEQIKTKLARDQAINSAKELTAQRNSKLKAEAEAHPCFSAKNTPTDLNSACNVLGLNPASINTTDFKNQITKAYKKKALPCHQDKGNNPEYMKNINAAKTIIDDFLDKKEKCKLAETDPKDDLNLAGAMLGIQDIKELFDAELPLVYLESIYTKIGECENPVSKQNMLKAYNYIQKSIFQNRTTSDDVSELTDSQNSSRNSSFSTIGSNQGQEQKPVQDPVSGQEITEPEFNNAIVAIKHLFNMKMINDLKLSNVVIKKNNLLKIITENRPQDKDQITNIINNAFKFYKLAQDRRSSIPLTEIKMFRDYIRYDYMDDHYKKSLKPIYDGFYEQYKTLGFSNSNIYLKPNSNNNQTRKTQSINLCDKISQLIKPMYSNRTIPSQVPKLTKINITKKVVKDEIKRVRETNDKATAEAKAQEETNKEIKEDIAKLEGMLKSGVKGGTRKQRKQIQIQISNRKKNFKSKVTRKR